MSTPVDQYFTPDGVAVRVASYIPIRRPRILADFAAGDGALLRTAIQYTRPLSIIATDVDLHSVRALKRLSPNWNVGRCDFLSGPSRTACAALRNIQGCVDVVVLNPPFSYRGAAYEEITYAGVKLRCSKALAFVLQSITYLSPKGVLIAVLPVGCLTSEKDARARELLAQKFKLEILRTNGHRIFQGCFPKTAIVRLSRRSAAKRGVLKAVAPKGRKPILISRGTMQMHRVTDSKTGVRLVHTTNMRTGKVSFDRVVEPRGRLICGHLVLLPRVGEPSIDKICVLTSREAVLLSDCVVSIACNSHKAAVLLRQTLLKDWRNFQKLYGGTCARYVTLDSLSAYLLSHGYRDRRLGNSPITQ